MTTAATAIDGLIALLGSTPELSGVQVLDGQPTTNLEPDAIVVGWAANRVAVDAQRDTDDGLTAQVEEYDVVCLATSWRGDSPMKPVRDRAVELYTLAVEAVRRDPTLGRAVARSRSRFVALDQAQTTQGPTATVEFLIHATAFTR